MRVIFSYRIGSTWTSDCFDLGLGICAMFYENFAFISLDLHLEPVITSACFVLLVFFFFFQVLN